jgi:hypothetical protein
MAEPPRPRLRGLLETHRAGESRRLPARWAAPRLVSAAGGPTEGPRGCRSGADPRARAQQLHEVSRLDRAAHHPALPDACPLCIYPATLTDWRPSAEWVTVEDCPCEGSSFGHRSSRSACVASPPGTAKTSPIASERFGRWGTRRGSPPRTAPRPGRSRSVRDSPTDRPESSPKPNRQPASPVAMARHRLAATPPAYRLAHADSRLHHPGAV